MSRLAWLLLSLLLGCDLAEQDLYALRITAPENDATFTEREDANPLADGMQIGLRVETANDGVPIELLRLLGGEPELIARGTSRNRELIFSDVPLRPGANRLQARDARNDRTSQPITVYFEDPCGAITFVSPAAPGARQELVVGPTEDSDGTACGETFAISLLAGTGLPDGTRVTALVDGRPVASAPTLGGLLTLSQVPLDKRGEPAELALLVEGKGCAPVVFPADIRVDCAGPSCSITSFGNDALLTSGRDGLPDTPGLELDIVVRTDEDGRGQPVELVINGDQENALVSETSAGSDEASFPLVALPDGALRVKATCTDGSGARTTNTRTLTVDTLGCAVGITSPLAGALFVAEPRQGTLEISVSAEVGGDCQGVRFAALKDPTCAGLAGLPVVPVSLGQTAVTQPVTLASDGDQFLCVGTLDVRGNPNFSALPIRFENAAPELEFSDPVALLAVSRVAEGERLADLDLATRACERPVSVTCGLPNQPVELVRMPDDVVLATAPCLAGSANFASVPFPSENDGSSYDVVARQTAPNGLLGESEALRVEADCDPPALAFGDYACGVTAIAKTADERGDLAGIQHTVRVTNTPNPKPAVTLQLRRDGAPLGEPVSGGVEVGPATVFAEVTLPEGVITLEACATDPSGNAACTGPCELLVGEVPSVIIREPARDHLVYSVDLSGQGVAYRNGPPADLDCAPEQPGLQIPLSAEVAGAPAGRAARVQLLAADRSLVHAVDTSVAPDGSVSACLQSEEGAGLILRVEVDADEAGLFGAAERQVEVDTVPPEAAPAAHAEPVACRGPSVVHIDTQGSAASNDELALELRCAEAMIETELDWSAAQRVTGEPNPNPNTGGLSWNLPGGLPGESLHCSLRGYDRAGAYTPLGEALAIESPPLREQVIGVPASLAPDLPEQLTLTALGDVNGDGYDDVLLAGGSAPDTLGGAALYLGSADGLATTPAVSFVSQDSYQLGATALALGNFDGDAQGRMDFALGAPGSARLFVVFGRTEWPSGSVAVDAGGCGVDLCIQGDAHEQLGRSLASARFDADALPDLVAGAESAALVILGNALYEPAKSLGAHGAGTCLDARTSPQPDACGSGRSQAARGFRLETPAAVDWALSSEPGRLFLAHGGGAASPALWYARRRNYNLVEELVRVPSSELTLVEQLPAQPWGMLSVVGDLDGDGRGELGWSHATSVGGLLVLAREGTDELYQAFTLANDGAAAADDAFARSVAQGAHPELGLIGDVDGDGLADLLLGSDQAGTGRGSVELFRGFQPLPGDERGRSSRALVWDDNTLLTEPDVSSADYPRRGQYLGDVDGDGHLELAVLEPGFEAGAARFIVLGACAGSPP